MYMLYSRTLSKEAYLTKCKSITINLCLGHILQPQHMNIIIRVMIFEICKNLKAFSKLKDQKISTFYYKNNQSFLS